MSDYALAPETSWRSADLSFDDANLLQYSRALPASVADTNPASISPNRGPSDELLAAADIVVTIGYDPVVYDPSIWRWSRR